MKQTIYLIAIIIMFAACKQNFTTKEASEAITEEIATSPAIVDSATTAVPQQTIVVEQPKETPKLDLPFVGTRTFCVVKDENQSSGTFKLTILKDGTFTYNLLLKDNGQCGSEGCEIDYKGKLKGYKCTSSEYGTVIFFNENKFEWLGEEDGFTAQLCE